MPPNAIFGRPHEPRVVVVSHQKVLTVHRRIHIIVHLPSNLIPCPRHHLPHPQKFPHSPHQFLNPPKLQVPQRRYGVYIRISPWRFPDMTRKPTAALIDIRLAHGQLVHCLISGPAKYRRVLYSPPLPSISNPHPPPLPPSPNIPLPHPPPQHPTHIPIINGFHQMCYQLKTSISV